MGSVKLRQPAAAVAAQIAEAIQAAEAVQEIPTDTDSEIAVFRGAYLSWEARTQTVLQTAFEASGFMTSAPADEFNAASVGLLDLKIASTVIPKERVREVRADISERIRVLTSIRDRLDVYELVNAGPAARQRGGPSGEGPIFLVHGHNIERREIVRRFMERISGREVVVLDEQANEGRDVLGKLLDHAVYASFAVVLLTADDEGGEQGGPYAPRARQNVVLELGLFLGLLGRTGVVALYEPGVEIPSDISGVLYIETTGEGWQIGLAREMKAAGLDVSLDKAL